VTELSTDTAIRPADTESIAAPATRPAASGALRVRESTAAIVPYLSYGAQRLGRSGVIGLSLCIFSFIAFVSGNLPLREQLRSQAADLEVARETVADRKPRQTSQSPQAQANRFVDSLPGRNDIPKIMGSIVTIAAATGIQLERGNYEYVASDDDAIARYRMLLPVTGSYPQVRKFVENLLATVPAIALDNVRIERDNISDQVIAADLRFSVLLEGGL
jgi:Tfp pilus assembly protein PilO